ncbi:MAG TPA: RNA 2',3'-cyclic phosphodiesterase [Gemmataceae bacterium]|nr:RNA 2',3'-cyclic phosphodiesterase [Gemmataceae bacterium]
MARLRTFIAVDVGKAIRDRLVALQDTLARAGTEVKWVEENNLHVTLLFLGEVEDRETPALCQAVADCCAGRDAFSISVETVGCFPNPRRPRVVWAGIGAGSAELIALHDALEPPLLDLGCYRREDRAYTPHITLGRVRGERSPTAALATALARQAKWQGGETNVREIHVLSSELTPQGPIYTVLSRAKLRT